MTTYDKASLVMIPSGYKDDKLYSIKPTNGDGDFTFSRDGAGASPATRVNASGLIEKGRENLLTYSNTFSNAVWVKGGASVTGGQTGYDGSSDAWALTPHATAGSHRVYHSSVNSSGIVTCSVYAKANGYSHLYIYANTASGTDRAAWFDLVGGSVGTQANKIVDATITSVGGGWYRCDVKQDNTLGLLELYVGDGEAISFTGNGTSGILIQDCQVESGLVATDYIETTTAPVSAGLLGDMPRLDYSGGATCPSLLLEPSRVNLWVDSEYMGAYAQLTNVSIATNNTTSPEGVQNATKVTADAVSGKHEFQRANINFTSGTTYTASCFVKANGYNFAWIKFAGTALVFDEDYAWFDLSDGTKGVVDGDVTATIEPYGSDWYRITATRSALATGSGKIFFGIGEADNTPDFTGDGISGVYFYGFQVESGSYPTSYIPTYGAASGRAVEYYEKTSATDLIGQTEGTLFVEFVPNTDVISSKWIAFLGDGAQYIGIYVVGGTNAIRLETYDNAVTSGFNTSSGIVEGQRYKCAIAYANNDFTAYVNGVQLGTDTSGSVPATSKIKSAYNTTNVESIDTNQLLVFKTRLTNAELASLTTL